ncbi:MAG: AAA family ATPase [Aurantibacter sp.]
MVILVLGLPGSGKSYFASRLAEMIQADYVNSDRLRKELFSKRTYSDLEKTKVYNAMLGKMEEAVAKKKNVVVDTTFHKKETRELFKKKTEERMYFIEVWADENITRERLKKSRPYSEADFEIYRIIREQWQPLAEPRLVLESTNENIDDMLQKAAQYLKDDKSANR